MAFWYLLIGTSTYALSNKDETDSPKRRQSEFSEESINPHAHKIVLKVAEKLNGRELVQSIVEPGASAILRNNSPVQTEPMNPNEQVDFLIKKATNLSNLALMYEGWSAWV